MALFGPLSDNLAAPESNKARTAKTLAHLGRRRAIAPGLLCWQVGRTGTALHQGRFDALTTRQRWQALNVSMWPKAALRSGLSQNIYPMLTWQFMLRLLPLGLAKAKKASPGEWPKPYMATLCGRITSTPTQLTRQGVAGHRPTFIMSHASASGHQQLQQVCRGSLRISITAECLSCLVADACGLPAGAVCGDRSWS